MQQRWRCPPRVDPVALQQESKVELQTSHKSSITESIFEFLPLFYKTEIAVAHVPLPADPLSQHFTPSPVLSLLPWTLRVECRMAATSNAC